ncbi:hypothetical protein PARMER_01945 [Parabacteroides merdae ATCC 43184]|nr:hypothetical protein PARMER_01945 [Parabacteroides merdae ATCC 43184]
MACRFANRSERINKQIFTTANRQQVSICPVRSLIYNN